MKNPKAISGYDCNKKEPGFIAAWSTEGSCSKEV